MAIGAKIITRHLVLAIICVGQLGRVMFITSHLDLAMMSAAYLVLAMTITSHRGLNTILWIMCGPA